MAAEIFDQRGLSPSFGLQQKGHCSFVKLASDHPAKAHPANVKFAVSVLVLASIIFDSIVTNPKFGVP